ncbi:MAG: hypothetical protein ACFFED_06315, partial [Candidatus Thorarchaeota archaeon]
MKPLGTITICFPHVSEDTKVVLESVMAESEHYGEFCKKLCELAQSENVSEEVLYFAVFHSYNIDEYTLLMPFIRNQSAYLIVEPLLQAVRTIHGESIRMEAMRETLAKALECIPNDWLGCHLYLAWRKAAESWYPESDTQLRIMDILDKRIMIDPDYKFFKSLLIGLEAYQLLIKGYHADALVLFKQGLMIARKFDDLPLVSDGLYYIASIIRSNDTQHAIDMMLESTRIGRDLGYSWGVARNLEFLRSLTNLRGEYNASLQYSQEYHDLTTSINHPEAFADLTFPLVYT